MRNKVKRIVILLLVLFWSAFWPSAFIILTCLNDKLVEEVKQSEYLPVKEKIKMIGEY